MVIKEDNSTPIVAPTSAPVVYSPVEDTTPAEGSILMDSVEPEVEASIVDQVEPEVPEAQPGLNKRASSDLAIAISKRLNLEDPGYVERLYESGGKLPEWEMYKSMYARTGDAMSATRIVDLAIKDAKENGLDNPDPSNPNFLNLVRERAREKAEHLKNPELVAYVDALIANKSPEDNSNREMYKVMSSDGVERIISREQHHTAINAAELYNEIRKIRPDFDTSSVPKIIGETIVGAVPFWNTFLWKDLGDTLGIEGPNLDPGTTMAKARRKFVEASDAEQRIMVREIAGFLREHSDAIGDMEVASIVSNFTDEGVMGGDPSGTVDTFLNSVFFWAFDVVPTLGGTAKILSGSLKRASGAIRVARATDKKVAGELLAEAVTAPNNPKEAAGLSKAEIQGTQMPKAGALVEEGLEDVPGILDEIRRIDANRLQVSAVQAKLADGIYTAAEKASAIARETREIAAEFQGQVRPNLSTYKYVDDGSSVDINTVLGFDEDNGYTYLTDALELAKQVAERGYSVRVLQSDGELIKPILTREEALETLSELQKIGKDVPGEFYVEFTKPYSFKPKDKGMFGDDIVVTPDWLGRATPYVEVPDAIFSKEFYEGFSSRYRIREGLTGSFKNYLYPVADLPSWKRRRINYLYEKAAKVYRETGRDVSLREIKEWAGEEVTNDELLGLYTARRTADVMYEVLNDDLRGWFKKEGAKTLRKVGTTEAYHGTPIPLTKVEKMTGGSVSALDPVTGTIRVYTEKEIKELYARNGTVVKLPLEEGSATQAVDQIIFDPKFKTLWDLQPLARKVLKYEPWYYPRMLVDNYNIEKVVKGELNGIVRERSSLFRVARTSGEQKRTIKRLNKKYEKDGKTFFRAGEDADPRFVERDPIKADLNRLRMEGRLIWGTRQDEVVMDAFNKNAAETVDPIEALSSVGRTVATHVSQTEFINANVEAWRKTFGTMLTGAKRVVDGKEVNETFGDITSRLTYGQVEVRLRELISGAPPGSPKLHMYNQAYQSWKHIAVMDGVLNKGIGMARRLNVQFAELLHEILYQGKRKALQLAGKDAKGALEDPITSRAVNFLVRNGHEYAITDVLKNVAFTFFIIARPVKQFFLQASQHMLVQSIDPVYFGRLQGHAAALLAGSKGLAGQLLHGTKEWKLAQSAIAKTLGMSVDESRTVIKEFFNSGLTQKINVHSVMGDYLTPNARTPKDLAAQASSMAWGAITLRPLRNLAQHVGFDMGEQYNVAASYMLALRRHMIESKIPTVAKMKPKDWEKVANRANGYALAMDRANESALYQSVFGLPLQFSSYLQKSALLLARATPGLEEYGLKSFTVSEARRIVVGQLVLWGGAGVGGQELVKDLLTEGGVELRPKLEGAIGVAGKEIAEILESGVQEWVTDETFKWLANDPELDMDWAESYAPVSGFFQMAGDAYNFGADKSIIDWMAGPSGEVASRIKQSYDMGKSLWDTSDVTEMTPYEKYATLYTLFNSGQMAMFSDFLKYRAQSKMEHWIAASGEPTDLRAKQDELILNGFFGVPPESLEDYYFYRKEISRVDNPKSFLGNFKELDEDAIEYQKALRKVLNLEGVPVDSIKALKARTKAHRLLLSTLDPSEVEYLNHRFYAYEKNLKESQEPLSVQLLKAIVQADVPVTKHMYNRIDRLTQLSDEEKQAIKTAIQRKLDRGIAERDATMEFTGPFLEIPVTKGRDE